MSKVPEFEKVKCETPDLAKQNLEKLKALFPGVVTEGPDGVAIDVEALKQECSATPIEGNVERYEFTWPGKRAAKAAASTATNKTLRPCRAESVNFDTTENLYIEGDNLEVLKLLQTNYAGKVKMIYIDPPYNTGHDFVYRDRFSLTQKELESDAGTFDDDGNRFEVNDSSEARYHSNWCSMMYPRLKLARQLLRDDGVLFMSIDDNEVTNARRLCDEVFGASNFVAQIVWTNKEGGGGSDSKLYKVKHEYIVCVSRSIEKLMLNGDICEEDESYAFEDQWVKERGRYKLIKLNSFSIQYSASLDYPIKLPDGTIAVPSENGKKGCWRWSKEKYEWGVENGFVEFKKSQKGTYWVYTKQYFKVDNSGRPIVRSLPPQALIDKYSSTMASKQVEKLFSRAGIFDYSKPFGLLKDLTFTANCQGGIVLDFFSGSAAAAHAVMQLNAEDGGNRKFIMVQLPESCAEDSEAAKAGYKNICEIGKERIRRAGKKIAEENATTAPNLDIGFRVLKLDSSSLEDASETASGTRQQMLGLSRIKEDRTSEDLLFQVLLETKLSLSDRIEKKMVEGNEVFFVSDTALVACLDAKAKMTEKFFTALAKVQPALTFFRDDLFVSDSARINLAQIFKQFSPNTTITVI